MGTPGSALVAVEHRVAPRLCIRSAIGFAVGAAPRARIARLRDRALRLRAAEPACAGDRRDRGSAPGRRAQRDDRRAGERRLPDVAQGLRHAGRRRHRAGSARRPGVRVRAAHRHRQRGARADLLRDRRSRAPLPRGRGGDRAGDPGARRAVGAGRARRDRVVKGIARVATRARELAVVPRGGERGFLAPLPVGVLQDERTPAKNQSPGAQRRRRRGSLHERCGAALKRWGIATWARWRCCRPPRWHCVSAPAGARVHRLATGADDEPFVPQLPADALEEEIELDYAIYELEPLAFVLRGLVDRALARLACRSLACAGITLRLALDPRGLDVREILIAAPTREPATLLELVRLDLARRPPDAGVVGARLVALPARVRSTQLDFLRPAGPAPDRLAATLARLAALVGPENVGAPAPDTWREEAIAVAPYSVAVAPPRARAGGAQRAGGAALPARPGDRGADGPRRADGAARERDDGARARRRRPLPDVAANGGAPPEEDGDFARDYWDVHASDGAVYGCTRIRSSEAAGSSTGTTTELAPRARPTTSSCAAGRRSAFSTARRCRRSWSAAAARSGSRHARARRSQRALRARRASSPRRAGRRAADRRRRGHAPTARPPLLLLVEDRARLPQPLPAAHARMKEGIAKDDEPAATPRCSPSTRPG